ncbi:hypothetical protein DIPPA_00637 [Diplonema papillatum]|nr:hypothetical protein DIPPA_00637 [Diplonema papillatum]
MFAGALQVLLFMWLRTSMNHQYAFGGTFTGALSHLYSQGGIPRFYKGLPYAMVQAPLTRFGDTFAQSLVESVYKAHFPGGEYASVYTAVGSTAASVFRVLCTPIDTLKTTSQVHGDTAMAVLFAKVRQGGVLELFSGWEGNFVASWLGNYPWFFVFNTMQSHWPVVGWVGVWKHVRVGVIGVCATCTSDVVSNCVRVVKTIRQTHPDAEVGYFAAVRQVLHNDGASGLLLRGLSTRLLVNMLQGLFFTVVWKALSD